MTALERRYRWLLRAYPGWYRAQRGDEMLGTLLEAGGPDRSWPAARDARALILGGLRVRAWQHQRQTTAAALRQAVLLAAVLDLAVWSAQDLSYFRGEWGFTFPSMLFAWVNLILGLLTLAAMVGAWFGRRAVVAIVALAAAGLWIYQPLGDLLYMAVHPVLALAALAILIWSRASFSVLLPSGSTRIRVRLHFLGTSGHGSCPPSLALFWLLWPSGGCVVRQSCDNPAA